MSKMQITKEIIEAAVVGGSVLGGGGGGSMKDGLKMALQALEAGPMELIDIEDLSEDSYVVNVSAVGAPSAKTSFATLEDYAKAARLLCDFAKIEIAGFITNEMGGLATVNGWMQGALLSLPIIDAPSNGRAHPTGVMGAMGLHAEGEYESIQVAVGGNPALGKHIEVSVRSTIDNAAAQVRNAAVLAGGFVAVARNPVTAGYAKTHAANGAVKQAIALGRSMLAARPDGGKAVTEAVCRELGATVLHQGRIAAIDLTCKGGFDVGTIKWDDFELTFWNEYMTAEQDGNRLATFPDLIMTLDTGTGWPVTSAEVEEGQDVTVICASKDRIRLGAGMSDPVLFGSCEEATGKSMLSYIFT